MGSVLVMRWGGGRGSGGGSGGADGVSSWGWVLYRWYVGMVWCMDLVTTLTCWLRTMVRLGTGFVGVLVLSDFIVAVTDWPVEELRSINAMTESGNCRCAVSREVHSPSRT